MHHATRRTTGTFIGILLLCTLLYLPGLSGGFLFDDFPNIVLNPAIHVSTLDWREWWQVLWASPSSDLQRPLASLSFALNHYFSGLNPWSMKATNLVIHLLNGVLLFALLRRIARLAQPPEAPAWQRGEWLAALVAASWLLHPINLSPVLLIVQRMESMAQLFVLAGLIVYFDARMRQHGRRPGVAWRLWLAFPLMILLGVASKESAALLPLYALLLEFTVLRACAKPGALKAVFALFLALPAIAGLAWLLPGVFSEHAYASRAFTLGERLLTEPRVLLDYLSWTVLPAPGFFSFFRDDYVISTGLFTPWTTLPAILALLGISVAAWFWRQRRPLFALGWGWFLGAHALTATVFPLELVFEHRNYFASIGVLLAVFDLLLPTTQQAAFNRARFGGMACLLILAAFSLALRAKTWGNPLLLAISEAAQHPASPRATYHLGAAYADLGAHQPGSPYTVRAIEALEAAMRVPGSSTLPESGVIIVSSKAGHAVDPRWIDSMEQKLAHRPITPEDARAIAALTQCQREGQCHLDDARLTRLYQTALDKPSRSAWVLYSYGIHAYNRLHDTELALQLVREAARSDDLQFQANLVEFLLTLGRNDEAAQALMNLEQRDRRGSMVREIANFRARLGTSP